MATPFDGLKPFSFFGTTFPYRTYRVQGGIRKHEFNYPHSQGGVTEKLGRKLYEVHVTANFTAGLLKLYPNLWADLKRLRKAFEAQSTGFLEIPHIGGIQAFADSWTESVSGKDRSTIDVEMVFTEELPNDFNTGDVATTNSGTTLQNKVDNFNAQVLLNQLLLTDNTQNIFSAINNVCSSVLSVKDQIDLYGSLVVSKIDSAVAIIQEADQQVRELNNPDFWPLLDALHDLWSSTIQLQQDVSQSGAQLNTYTTPVRMTVAQVSAALFGDNSRAVDIMTLNPLDDPLSIPPGFEIQYYA